MFFFHYSFGQKCVFYALFYIDWESGGGKKLWGRDFFG